MDLESYFLTNLQKSGIVAAIDDDCALLKHNCPVIAMDSFIEGTHFLLQDRFKNQWLSYRNLAKKAMLVNVSDLISSGARPKFCLLAISLPKSLKPQDIKEIILGLSDVCRQYDIKLIGGDTTKGLGLGFHITLLGELDGKYLSRAGARCGDLVAYTCSRGGGLGGSLRILRILLRYGLKPRRLLQGRLRESDYERFSTPRLRGDFVSKAKRLLHSCMDISDGLGQELQRLQRLNKLGIKLAKPISHRDRLAYLSGEEYELLFSFAPSRLEALRRIARLCRVKIVLVGKFYRGGRKRFPRIVWH